MGSGQSPDRFWPRRGEAVTEGALIPAMEVDQAVAAGAAHPPIATWLAHGGRLLLGDPLADW